MYCTKCGNPRGDNDTVCANCGAPIRQFSAPPPPPPLMGAAPGLPGVPPAAPVKVDNYLVPAILVTLCCCLPFGIVAIVYAAQVNTKLGAGDYAGAQESAKNAKLWCWLGFGAGILIGIFYGFVGALNGLKGIH